MIKYMIMLLNMNYWSIESIEYELINKKIWSIRLNVYEKNR